MGGRTETTERDPGTPVGPALLLVAGAGQLTTHPLTRPEIVIGRAPECEVSIAHSTLSRRHAIVRPGPPVTVQDLGSTNGTRVAGRVVKGGDPVPLGVGESFAIGPFAFVVVSARGAAESSARTGQDALRVDDPTPQRVPGLVREIAQSPLNVLVLGETGVGKELLANTIHDLSGRKGPFLGINCAALTEQLLESELFGHEQGSFTGASRAKPGLLEAAAGGTVFLDEIGEMPAELQSKLLRAVEAREVRRVGGVKAVPIDVRFVAATNRDLASEVASGRFRADLFFRLDGVSLRIPPLRERRGMIGPLALRFLEAANKGPPRVAPELLAALEAHDWPGNVRELKATCERAVLLARGREITPRHVVVAPPAVAAAPGPAVGARPDLSPEQLDDRAKIVEALEKCAGNQTRAAKELGISRATLATRLALYAIPRPRAK